MAASSEWAEWHLTPKGWIKGSTKCEFDGIQRVKEPDDRIQTCVFSEKTHTGAQSLDREVTEIWSNQDKLDQIVILTEKFGNCPSHL